MEHQTHVLNLGAGELLLAVTHSEQRFAAEDLRNTAHVRFATATASDLSALRDISALAQLTQVVERGQTPNIRDNAEMMAMFKDMAQQEGVPLEALVAQAQALMPSPEQDILMRHLPSGPVQRAPRRVFASRNGRALLVYEAEIGGASGTGFAGVLRWLDVRKGCVLGEWASHRAPLHGPGDGVARFSSVQIGRALGLSWDGEHVLLAGGAADSSHKTLELCRLSDGLPTVASRTGLLTALCPFEHGWLALDQLGDEILWLDHQLQTVDRAPLPKQAMHWGLVATPDGRWVALPAERTARVLLIERGQAEVRELAPHPGALRNSCAHIALSDDGQWLATHQANEAALTRIADASSWPLGQLAPGQAGSGRITPTLAFIGNKLMCAEAGQLRQLRQPTGPAHSALRHADDTLVDANQPLSDLLAQANLGQHADALAHWHSPAALIDYVELGDAGWGAPGQPGAPALADSRFGGWPDMPQGEAWPQWEGRPMAFIAQINLAQAHAAQPGLALPSSGLLQFFLGSEDGEVEADEEDGTPAYFLIDSLAGERHDPSAWRVRLLPATAQLVRLPCPDSPLPERLKPCGMRFTAGGLALPGEDSMAYELLQRSLPAADFGRYNDVLDGLTPEEAEDDEPPREQLMGYPQLYQNTPPELMCEQAKRGEDPYEWPDLASPEGLDLQEAASRWGLLLQLGDSEETGLSCLGRIYFYGLRSAMAQGDFSSVWINYEH